LIDKTVMRFTGSISFRVGTPNQVVSDVLGGLAQWVNSLPICSGESAGQITLANVERQVLTLDTTNSAIPNFSIVVSGQEITQLNQPIPSFPGSIYVADLNALSVSYQ